MTKCKTFVHDDSLPGPTKQYPPKGVFIFPIIFPCLKRAYLKIYILRAYVRGKNALSEIHFTFSKANHKNKSKTNKRIFFKKSQNLNFNIQYSIFSFNIQYSIFNIRATVTQWLGNHYPTVKTILLHCCLSMYYRLSYLIWLHYYTVRSLNYPVCKYAGCFDILPEFSNRFYHILMVGESLPNHYLTIT